MGGCSVFMGLAQEIQPVIVCGRCGIAATAGRRTARK
jgi:hypothetical protein